MTSVLFVCLGNICRSPSAEAVFRKQAQEAGLSVNVDSAGTGAWHAGEPPDPRSRAAGEARGYCFDNIYARKVVAADFEVFDYICAMDHANFKALKRIGPKAYHHKIKLFLDFAHGQSGCEVPDPYYGGDDGFAQVLDLVEAASIGLIAQIENFSP